MNLDFLISMVFPRRCIGCKTLLREGVLCESCSETIPAPRQFSCFLCRRNASGAGAGSPASTSCADDVCDRRAWYHVSAATSYDHRVVKALIHSLKFSGIKAAAGPLADLIARYATASQAAIAMLREHIVVPIPLSRKRLRARGFNQAELIAKQFAASLRLPMETEYLVRVKNAKPQSETRNIAERTENIRGCFRTRCPAAIQGKYFILIDDVTTSGATFFEAAQALKTAGAARVVALAVAQA